MSGAACALNALQQRAEAAEARAAKLSESVTTLRAAVLSAAQIVAQLERERDFERDNAKILTQQLEAAVNELAECKRHNDNSSRTMSQALNEGDGVYRP